MIIRPCTLPPPPRITPYSHPGQLSAISQVARSLEHDGYGQPCTQTHSTGTKDGNLTSRSSNFSVSFGVSDRCLGVRFPHCGCKAAGAHRLWLFSVALFSLLLSLSLISPSLSLPFSLSLFLSLPPSSTLNEVLPTQRHCSINKLR